MKMTRRQLLAGTAGATAAAASLAGCSDVEGATGGAEGTPTVAASFLVVEAFAAGVAGTAATVAGLVPVGQHGHGWAPGPGVTGDALAADAFVYVGDGFQPWADRVVHTLAEADGDARPVEAWADVELLAAGDGHHDEADEHDGHDGADEHDGHDGADEHDDHDEAGDHDDHDHGPLSVDPHFWLDPTRAATAVGTVAAGLSAADPANADAYAANAAAYRDELATLDETFVSRLAGRSRETVLVAGHDSYRYLADRYGFTVEAVAGPSPDALPTPRALARAEQIVAEHDIEYVLAPVFESDRAARQLVAETGARAVLPITPVPALRADWVDAGWGFLDVLRQVNLPSLVRALGAE